MKKESIKYIAILLSFASVVTLFAACSKKETEEETTTGTTVYVPSEFKTEKEKFYTDENGKLYYRENPEDEGHELVTDENGITLVDKDGNMIQKVTDAEGNEVTQAVSFPNFINEGNRIACQQFTIICPAGWESKSNINFKMKNEAEGKSIQYAFVEETDKNYKNTEDNIAEIEKMFKSMVDDGTAVITKGTSQVAGKDAVKVVIETKGDNATYMEIYYVEIANGTMTFTCSCKPESKGFDFKAILDTVEYRIK